MNKKKLKSKYELVIKKYTRKTDLEEILIRLVRLILDK